MEASCPYRFRLPKKVSNFSDRESAPLGVAERFVVEVEALVANGLGRHREDHSDREALILLAEALHRITVEVELQDRIAAFDSWRARLRRTFASLRGQDEFASDAERAMRKQSFLQGLSERGAHLTLRGLRPYLESLSSALLGYLAHHDPDMLNAALRHSDALDEHRPVVIVAPVLDVEAARRVYGGL